MGETEHLSSYTLVAAGRDVLWKISDRAAVDLTNQPGQHVIAQMVDIFAAFPVRRREVVPLLQPKPGVAVNPEVRGGYPVIEGTRVPYDLVAALIADGVPPEGISAFYPSVAPAAARGARDFAHYVDGYREKAAG
jgi:uncharacterized protein (DUF433 family)